MKRIVLFLVVMIFIVGCGNNNSLNKGNGNKVWEGNNNDSQEVEEAVDSINITKGETKEITGIYGDKEIKAEVTLNNVFYTTKITPPSPTQSYYSYYEAEENNIYEVIDLTIKNIGTEYFSDYVLEGFLSDTCTPTFIFDGGYKYTGISITEIERDNDGEYDLGYFYGVDPLETKNLYLFTKVPSELQNSNLTVNVCFGDNPLKLNW